MKLMRCLFCGLLQDEPKGAKTCSRCGGELEYEQKPLAGASSYIQVQMELDQVNAPAGQDVDRYVLVTLRTPPEVPAREKAPTKSGREPINFTAVLDVSGSMSGEKINQAREAVRQALARLQDGDIFSLVTFSSEEKCLQEPVVIDPCSRTQIAQSIDKITAGGNTALCAGLELGLAKAHSFIQKSNLVLMLSDGQANVGETDLEKIGTHAAVARKEGITTSALGIGLDYNEALMSNLASEGGGRFYHLQNAHQIGPFLTGELGEMVNYAAREAELVLQLPPGSALIPLSTAYPSATHDQRVTVTIGVIPCDVELEIPMRLILPAQNEGTKLSVEGELRFLSPADHSYVAPLNRVTLRFVRQSGFRITEGVVTPVAEKILEQMRATQVVHYSTLRARRPQQAMAEAQKDLDLLSQYAERLGHERARTERENLESDFNRMTFDPLAAKLGIFNANMRTRGTKDFGKRS